MGRCLYRGSFGRVHFFRRWASGQVIVMTPDMPIRSSAETSATLPQREIARLVEMRAVHSAFLYLHNQEMEFRRWQRELTEIPAPPFGEAARSKWLAERFNALGLEQVQVDELGNVCGSLMPPTAGPWHR